MNIQQELTKEMGISPDMYLNNIEIEASSIKAVMINEVVPSDPTLDFYGNPDSEYFASAAYLFQRAGVTVDSIQNLLRMGIYLTNAVKTPKTEYSIEKSSFEKSLPYLKSELALFPNTQVVMLMGDVAKKAYNLFVKEATGKNVVPSISTYKLRTTELYYGSIRVIPSYIMTGGNIRIEKSKAQMAAEDIAKMLEIIA